MRVQDVKIGEYYRHHSAPHIGWAKALQVLKPKEHPNTNTYSVVKCEWSVDKHDNFGFVKYFRAVDLVKDKNAV